MNTRVIPSCTVTGEAAGPATGMTQVFALLFPTKKLQGILHQSGKSLTVTKL